MSYFFCKAKHLKEQIEVFGKIAPKKNMGEISSILARVEDKVLRMTSTNLEQTIIRDIVIDKGEDGIFLIPRDIITKLLRTSTKHEDIEVRDNESKVEIRIGRSKMNCNTTDHNLFPTIENPKIKDEIVLSNSDMERVASGPLKTVASEDARFGTMTGVEIEVSGKEMRFTGMDGLRLSSQTCKPSGDSWIEYKIVVPAESMKIARSIAGINDIGISIDGVNQIWFRSGNIKFGAKLINGNLPRWSKPKVDFTFGILVSTFVSSIERASVMMGEDSNSVDFEFKERNVTISSKQEKGSGEVDCEVEWPFPPKRFRASPKFLMECLKSVQAETMNVGVAGDGRAWIFDSDGGYNLIMMMEQIGMAAPARGA